MFFINEYLRKQVKLLHALQGIKYKELAEYLEIKPNSFWSWLHGFYDFGYKKAERLNEIIGNLREYEL